MAGPTVLYFDGVCNLCNRLVDWLLRRDRTGRLRFAPLQGETAAAGLPPEVLASPPTVVLQRNGRLATRSTAAIEAVALLGGPWRAIALLKVVPRPLRDAAYDALAARRYAWFGRRDTCRLPDAAERDRFLP